jgi:proteasome lid subunit RPN8/RPN11
MVDHASAFLNDRKEVLGLLIGREKDEKTLIIERVAPITEGSESSVQMHEPEFSIYERLYLDENAGEFVLGWYHSHPRWGLFLSSIDIETHSLSFQLRYPKAVAIVLDPALAENEYDPKTLEIFRVINPKNWTSFEYEAVIWTIEQGNSSYNAREEKKLGSKMGMNTNKEEKPN